VSQPVDLAALRDRLDEYGDAAFLVTVNDDGTPHVVSVSLRHDGDRLVMAAGRRTRANLERSPAATLLWAPRPDPAYSLIVDVAHRGSADEREITLEPHAAILHRVAGAPGDGPTCLPLSEAGPGPAGPSGSGTG
jgi:hypothetical protein